jgi:hypothetical protein
VFSSCRLARCPHCGASQFPTVELHSPINAFEHDPSVAVLFEETNVSYGSDGDTSEDAGLGCYLDPKLPCKENAHTGSTTPSPCNSVDKIHSALTSILSPCTSTEESCVSNTSRCAWGRQSIPLLLPKQTAAELLVLMTHARCFYIASICSIAYSTLCTLCLYLKLGYCYILLGFAPKRM